MLWRKVHNDVREQHYFRKGGTGVVKKLGKLCMDIPKEIRRLEVEDVKPYMASLAPSRLGRELGIRVISILAAHRRGRGIYWLCGCVWPEWAAGSNFVLS